MIITGKEGSFIISGDVQPNGVDIQVKNVYRVLDKDINAKVSEEDYVELDIFTDRETGKKYWIMQPKGAYLFQIDKMDLSRENTKIPLVGYVVPKSRFCRCGISVHSALWDVGYVGAGRVLVVNHSSKRHKIFKDMYFGQVVFFEAKNGTMTYNGSHQNEGLK